MESELNEHPLCNRENPVGLSCLDEDVCLRRPKSVILPFKEVAGS